MRFDDRLETALRQAHDSISGTDSKWQQLIDLLAQNPLQFSPNAVAAGLIEAKMLMSDISLAKRLACVTALAGRILSPPLVQLLAGDVPPVAAAAIAGARLTDREWAEIVPFLPVRARGFLRNRNDLGLETRRALAAWSGADFVLPSRNPDLRMEIPEVSAPVPNTQIRDIVERIENLRRHRELAEAPILPSEGSNLQEEFEPAHEICFETDENGLITRLTGAPSGAVVGVDITEPAFDEGPGPDAYGAAAFRHRMAMDNARMRLCGSPTVAGDWRINASPFFNARNGRFKGYRGVMRRPNMVESARMRSSSGATGADEMQQIVHELRTPLGAIIGFSEIIEQQLFGPVMQGYRVLARNILNDAERLLAGFDDLAMAAKVQSGNFSAVPGTTECSWLVTRLAKRLHDLSNVLKVNLTLTHAQPVRPFSIDNDLAERMFSRLLSAVIVGCQPGEELNGRFRTEPGSAAINRFVLTLPQKLQTMTETELFESGPVTHDDLNEAPLLGLGFSLRLVRSLAQNVGGDLRFYNEALILSVPAMRESRYVYRDEERE